MNQDDIISALFDGLKWSFIGLYRGDGVGRHALCELLRKTADYFDGESQTHDDMRILMDQIAAWNRAKIEMYTGMVER